MAVLRDPRNSYDGLVSELAEHLRTIAQEAKQGDADSQQWLMAAYPGHWLLFQRHWSGAPNRQRREIAGRRRGEGQG